MGCDAELKVKRAELIRAAAIVSFEHKALEAVWFPAESQNSLPTRRPAVLNEHENDRDDQQAGAQQALPHDFETGVPFFVGEPMAQDPDQDHAP